MQREDINISEALYVLDAAIELYPVMDSRLKCDAEIVMFPHFEAGMTKIQDGRLGELNPRNIDAVRELKSGSVSVNDEDSEVSLSLAARAVKRRRE